MGQFGDGIKTRLHRIETFVDGLVVGYKWRFNRFKHLRIDAFRGFGTPDAFFVRGRVLDDRRVSTGVEETSAWRNFVNMLQRIETSEIPGARVRLTYGACRVEVETDADGYFEVTLRPPRLERPGEPWQEVEAELLAPAPPGTDTVRARASILVPLPDAEFGIISDVDDTVLHTGATDRFTMYRVILFNNVHTRTPFEGIVDFYRALCEGPDGQGHNPLFYLSRSAWNLYDFFDQFLRVHDVPAGPLLLRNVGLGGGAGPAGDGVERKLAYKLDWIDRLLDTYPHLPFVLLGDSGQHDPEVYRAVVRKHPGRIRAIFIRDVTEPRRDAEVHAIAGEVGAMGVPMVLAQDTAAAAEAARRLGLVAPRPTRTPRHA